MLEIIAADSRDLITRAKELFREYADSLGFDLSFQDFEREMATFPAWYSPPRGCLLLARRGDDIAGCVALQDIGGGKCEMKRLYVRPCFRGRKVGRALAEAIIKKARDTGYTHMRLDTTPSMEVAIGLYTALGFRKIESYRFNSIEGATYLELDLETSPGG